MSAGTGIYHSEHATDAEDTELFQIWIYPDQKNYPPHYEQKDFRELTKTKGWHTLVSNDGKDHSICIRQNASIQIARLDKDDRLFLPPLDVGRGFLLLVMNGSFSLNTLILNQRDEVQITDSEECTIDALEEGQILLFDVALR